MIGRIFFATAAITAFASTAALTAPPRAPVGAYGVVAGKNKAAISATHVRKTTYSRPVRTPGTAPTTIFSNLAYPYTNGLYWAGNGYVTSGPKSDWGTEFWEAAAFTPTADVTATEIELALTYFDGTNAATITLNADNGGCRARRLRREPPRTCRPLGPAARPR
jgi:hypothetical protein